jgi:TonB family protein
MKMFIGVLAGVVLSQAAVSVQTRSGALAGAVTDGVGALPGVSIHISSPALPAPRALTSNVVGQFGLQLPAGEYEVELSLPGFQTVRGPVTVNPGATSSVTFLLPVGALDEHVIVRSSLPVSLAPSSPPARAAGPVRIGGDVRPPTKIADVTPVYPAVAQAAGIAGDVRIEAVIGRDGTVTSAKVVQGVPMLDAAALDAVTRWRYTPALLNHAPTEVTANVTVTFAR